MPFPSANCYDHLKPTIIKSFLQPLHFSIFQPSKMYALTIIVAALGLATASPASDFSPRQVAAVASVDRYAGAGCRSTICNKAGSGDLHAGCNAITDACQASLRLNYANAGCKGT